MRHYLCKTRSVRKYITMRLLFLSFIAAVPVAAIAQPIDARDHLIYPVNPPRPVERQISPMTEEIKMKLIEEYRKKRIYENLLSEDSASDIFLRAYKMFQEAEILNQKDPDKAKFLFAEVLSDLIALKKSFPEWQSEVVDYRIEKVKSILK